MSRYVPEQFVARAVCQVQDVGIHDAGALYAEVRGGLWAACSHKTLFRADLVRVVGGPHDGERIVPSVAKVLELDPDAEAVRVFTAAPEHFREAAPIVKRLSHRCTKRVGDERQCIHEVALARSVRPDKERKGTQRYVAGGVALVCTELYAGYEEPPTCVVRRGH